MAATTISTPADPPVVAPISVNVDTTGKPQLPPSMADSTEPQALLIPAVLLQIPSGLAGSAAIVAGFTSGVELIKSRINGVNNPNPGVNVAGMVVTIAYSLMQTSTGMAISLLLSTLH